MTRSTLIIMSLLLAGCGSARVGQPLTESMAGSDMDSQLEFWHVLAERPITSNDEAFHGLLLFVDGEDSADDYAARVASLDARGLLPKGFDRAADEAVLRGTLAVALVKVLDIKGGVVMRIVGPKPRYATRELQYLKIYPPSSPQQTFRGDEFLFVIGRVEDYMRKVDRKAPAKQLPEQKQSNVEATS